MCGIAGIVSLSPDREVTEDELRAMNRAQAHRGPDADGIHLESAQLGLAHVRLSILDLRPESDQPFHVPEHDLVVVFNGEIFNYLEIRDELEGLGHSFRTTSDTEVLVKAYAQWGDRCVERFNGMWGFAIHDRKRQRLFCSRDRFGIKPFNYGSIDGRFLFASEIKSILAVCGQRPAPNYRALALMLKVGIGAQFSETCFDGIHRLPPAHNLVVEGGQVTTTRYWDYPTGPFDPLSEEEAALQLRELLGDAVRLRLRSDVPVGISLSSGLDSSAIARLVRDQHSESVCTFTSVYEDGYRSEYPQARAFAESLDMETNPISFVGRDLLGGLRTILGHLESPHGAPAVLPYWNITSTASKKVKVLLEGQGADELLAGYVNICLAAALKDMVRTGRLDRVVTELGYIYKTAREEQRMGLRGPGFYALMIARMLLPRSAHDVYRKMRGDEYVYLGPLREAGVELHVPHPGHDGMGSLNRALVEQHAGGLVSLLHYGDAISMAHGLEARVPFMDYRLVELAFRLPGSYKLKDGYGKAVLLNALEKDLPASINRTRYKFGFTTPLSQWLRDGAQDLVEPVLFGEQCIDRGLFDQSAMKKLVVQHVSGRKDHASQIFRWIATELWFQRFIDAS